MDQLASFEIHNLGLMRRHSVSSLKTNSTYLTFASGTELSTSTAQTTSTTSSLIPLNGPVGSSPYPKLRLNDKSAEDRSWPAITKSKKKFGFFKDGKDTSTVAGAFAVTPEEYGIAPSRQDPKFIVKYTYNADDEDSTWYVSRGVPSGLAARARDRVKAEEQVGATVYAVSDEQRAEMERALGSLDDTPDPIEMALKELKRAKMTKESEGSQSQAKDGDNSPGRSGRGSDGGKKSAEEDARSAGAAVAQENVEDMERVFNRRPEARPRTPSPLARAMDDVMSYLDSVELDWKRSRKPWHALPRQPITMSETDYSAIKSYSPPKGRKVLSFGK